MLSPRDLAAALGVSESSLKRWVDSGRINAARTEGGHRRIELGEAMRFIRETGTPISRPELLDLGDVAIANRGGKSLFDYLYAGDLVGARGSLISAYLAGETIATLADGPVRSALARIGELWHASPDGLRVEHGYDEQGVFIEHRATDVCLHAVAHLRTLLPTPPSNAPVALGCAPATDPYMIPTQLAAMVTTEAGMRAINIGPDTPEVVLARAIAEHDPQLIWLSITTAPTPARVTEIVRWLGRQRVRVAVGGQHAHALGRLPANVVRLGSFSELSELARTML